MTTSSSICSSSSSSCCGYLKYLKILELSMAVVVVVVDFTWRILGHFGSDVHAITRRRTCCTHWLLDNSDESSDMERLLMYSRNTSRTYSTNHTPAVEAVTAYMVFHKKGPPFLFFIIHSNDDLFTQNFISCSWGNSNSKCFNKIWLLIKYSLLVVT